jgi:hypothetical protein
MNTSRKKEIGLAVLVIAVGVAWLLNVWNVIPGVDWVWTGGLGVIGILTLALAGLNQLTVIIGPFIIIGLILSILRQTGRLSTNVEVPVLVIVFGALLLCSYLLRVPLPKYLQLSGTNDQNKFA